MIKYIKSWFLKPEENTPVELTMVLHEPFIPFSEVLTGRFNYNDFELAEIDLDKPIILVIDDNEGMVSFLCDDLEEIFGNKLHSMSVLALSGRDAAFNLKKILTKYELNIKYAIIDITLGGSLVYKKHIFKYTGVDVFEMIYSRNKKLNYIFYTGNNLNMYIKSNKRLVELFYDITNEDIFDHVLFKTSLGMDDRRIHLKEKLKI